MPKLIERPTRIEAAGTFTAEEGVVVKMGWQVARRVFALSWSVVAACAVVTLGAQAQASSQGTANHQQLIRSLKGSDLFRAYCAPCHGADGKGNGPAASALKAKVPDLTLLAQRNGGTFPSAQVSKTILGDDTIAAHGSREMPVWGPIFHEIEQDVDRGNVRIDNLVKYLASIQAPK
jgi:mono/diheme cytochrome c family protein